MTSKLICDVNSYIYSPMNHSREIKFLEIFGEIKGGKGLDLGSGYAGIYWLLGYFEKIDSIDFLDYFEDNVNQLENIVSNISPDYLDENFSDTILFLKERGFIKNESSSLDICSGYIDKISKIEKFDFFNEIGEKYDFIISSEVIECVSNYDDFLKVIKNIYNGLNNGGLFIGNMLQYNTINNITEKLIELKQEGKLNPGLDDLKNGLELIGFKIKKLKVETNERGNMIFFVGEK